MFGLVFFLGCFNFFVFWVVELLWGCFLCFFVKFWLFVVVLVLFLLGFGW